MSQTKAQLIDAVDGSIVSADLASDAVTTAKIADDAVTNAKIADDAIQEAQIANGAVTPDRLNTSAVTTVKIADDAVTSAKIADDAITNAQLANPCVQTENISDDAVTADKLANSINTAIAANTAKDLTALSASNLTSGTVPDARFPATLPAVSGANLTNLPAGGTTIPQGTVMLFQQTNAPTGFTKITTHNDKALRLVSGTPGSGGSNTFSTAFNGSRSTSGGSVSNHTLSISEMPSHNHNMPVRISPNGNISIRTSDNPLTNKTTDSTGGGGSHNHGFTNPSLNLDVQYVDVIMASKD